MLCQRVHCAQFYRKQFNETTSYILGLVRISSAACWGVRFSTSKFKIKVMNKECAVKSVIDNGRKIFIFRISY